MLDPTTALAPPRRTPGVPSVHLRVDDRSVEAARRYVLDVLHLHGSIHPDLTETAKLLVSEMATNAIAAARDYANRQQFSWTYLSEPIHVSATASRRLVHLAVRDPDPAPPVRGVHGLMDEHGRGLLIVESLAEAVWPETAEWHKTMHAVIAAPGVTLTPAELGGR